MTDADERARVPAAPAITLRGGGVADAEVRAIAARLAVHPRAVRLLRARGIADEAALARALVPKLRDLRAPEQMAGFPAALELLLWAHRRRARVGVFGDYDVDGVCTAAILAGYLDALGLQVVVRVAHRDSGYGFTVGDADAFAAAGVQLVLCGDTGTSDVEALSRARARGMRSVVIDHHQVPEVMPPCDALINPHQQGCGFPFKGLCSAGVAFYLCAALRTKLGPDARAPDPRGWLDLVALATICDMMPLVDENRVLVAKGLESLARAPRPGLRALLERAQAWGEKPVDEVTVGFRVGPRLNAPGRLGSAEPALRLLRARTPAEAGPLAEHVEVLNVQRKAMSERTVAEALAAVAADPRAAERRALCVAHEGWSAGVVGLAAGTIAERLRKPAAVLSIDVATGTARGSVRSDGLVDVRAALAACAPWLERFGGHREAAGLSLARDQIAGFTEAFDAACAAASSARAEGPLEHDGELGLPEIDVALAEGLRALAPWGMGFPAPIFLGRGTVESARVHKERHLGLRLAGDGTRVDAIAFGQAAWVPAVGTKVAFLFAPELDVYRGQTRVRVVIQRLWPDVGQAGAAGTPVD